MWREEGYRERAGGPKKPSFGLFLGRIVRLLLCLEHRPSPVALPGLGVNYTLVCMKDLAFYRKIGDTFKGVLGIDSGIRLSGLNLNPNPFIAV